ncbi:hypothetical protein GCM10023065_07540 [Microbacterium laevaniformans]|nr:2-keto-3-deoxy-L-rhamnonate aldolase RhmA [Microbacterium laevaniformans]GLJ63943.1 hypothetical protein GCM10017578_08310 [Microbacterium laevaniformans]
MSPTCTRPIAARTPLRAPSHPTSLGLLGQQTHPDVVAAVRRTFAAVRAAGLPVGVNAFDPHVAQSYLDDGAAFILVGADVALLARGSEALAARWVTEYDDTERDSY